MGRLRAESQSDHRPAAERHSARAPYSVPVVSSEPVRHALMGALLLPVEARLAQAPFLPGAPMLEVKPAERPLRVATALHLREVWKEAAKKAGLQKAQVKVAAPQPAADLEADLGAGPGAFPEAIVCRRQAEARSVAASAAEVGREAERSAGPRTLAQKAAALPAEEEPRAGDESAVQPKAAAVAGARNAAAEVAAVRAAKAVLPPEVAAVWAEAAVLLSEAVEAPAAEEPLPVAVRVGVEEEAAARLLAARHAAGEQRLVAPGGRGPL